MAAGTTTVDVTYWRDRLAELAGKHGVPGASLAVWAGGQLTEAVTGVLNTATGVEVTPDSLFQIGSITKVYTATLIATLVDDLDTPVVELLPDFAVADPQVSRSVTVRHLLAHTSGIDGDLFLDTGRGDDCLAKYVTACAELRQVAPLGATMSYCNAGYVVLGRIAEVLTGRTWDQALRERVLDPAGLRATVTLPEEALRFRAAIGHLGRDAAPSPQWGLMRAVGPAGLINATAADVVAFGRLHLTGGSTGNGDRSNVLGADLALLQRPEVNVPDLGIFGRAWGLGWALDAWPDRQPGTPDHRVLVHAGATIGQASLLYVLPDDGIVAALLANGGDTLSLRYEVFDELFDSLGINFPSPPRPPAEPVVEDGARHAGEYQRTGAHVLVTPTETGLHVRLTLSGPTAPPNPVQEFDLVPVGDGGYVAPNDQATAPVSGVFYDIADGSHYLHFGMRAVPRKGNQ